MLDINDLIMEAQAWECRRPRLRAKKHARPRVSNVGARFIAPVYQLYAGEDARAPRDARVSNVRSVQNEIIVGRNTG